MAKPYVKEIVYQHIDLYDISFNYCKTWAIGRNSFRNFLKKGANINTIDKK